MKRCLSFSIILISSLLIVGCGSLPAKQAPQAKQIKLPESWEHSQNNQPVVLKKNLLELVHSPNLKPLINKALKNNPSLKVTALQMKTAGVTVEQTAAGMFPQVDTTLTTSRSQSNTNPGGTNNYKLSLGVSWELDIWGKLADSKAAAQKDEVAKKADYQAARNSLAGNIIKEWFNYITLKKMVEVEQRTLESYRGNQDIIHDRYKNGTVSLQDLEAAKSSTASAASSLESKKLSLKQSKLVLQTYLGMVQPEDLKIPRELPFVDIPLADIPGNTIGLRPDIQSAYASIESADFTAKVAYKNMLPGFTLNPTISRQDKSPGDMLKATVVWDFLGAITAPIFRAGELKAAKELAELKAEIALWNYKNTLVAAVAEVENKLVSEKGLLLQQQHLKVALEHAMINQKNYEERYRQGLTDVLTLLTAQQTAFNLELSYLSIQKQLLQNRIELGLSLGLGI